MVWARPLRASPAQPFGSSSPDPPRLRVSPVVEGRSAAGGGVSGAGVCGSIEDGLAAGGRRTTGASAVREIEDGFAAGGGAPAAGVRATTASAAAGDVAVIDGRSAADALDGDRVPAAGLAVVDGGSAAGVEARGGVSGALVRATVAASAAAVDIDGGSAAAGGDGVSGAGVRATVAASAGAGVGAVLPVSLAEPRPGGPGGRMTGRAGASSESGAGERATRTGAGASPAAGGRGVRDTRTGSPPVAVSGAGVETGGSGKRATGAAAATGVASAGPASPRPALRRRGGPGVASAGPCVASAGPSTIFAARATSGAPRLIRESRFCSGVRGVKSAPPANGEPDAIAVSASPNIHSEAQSEMPGRTVLSLADGTHVSVTGACPPLHVRHPRASARAATRPAPAQAARAARPPCAPVAARWRA